MRYHGGTRGSVTLRYRRTETTLEELVRAVERVNPVYRVTVGDPTRVPAPTDDLDFRLISSGGAYEIPSHLARGKVTIVQFGDDGADWKLEALAQKEGWAIRKIIVSGEAQVQLERDFGAKRLPYYRVYDREGIFRGEGRTVEEVNRLCPR